MNRAHSHYARLTMSEMSAAAVAAAFFVIIHYYDYNVKLSL